MRFRASSLALVLLLFAFAASAQTTLAVQKVADGIWAAQPDRGANVGWFLYGDGVVAVDSGGDLATAKEVLRQIGVTTGGKPVRYLILTHAHADHSTGARAFVAAGAQVICQEMQRRRFCRTSRRRRRIPRTRCPESGCPPR